MTLNTLLLLALPLGGCLQHLLLPLRSNRLLLLDILAALALLLAALNLIFPLADELRLFLDATHNVLRDLLLLQFLLLVLLLGCHPLHRLLQLVSDLDERLTHALHVHLPRRAEDNCLVAVVDLYVDAVVPGGIGHPLLGDAEGHDGSGSLEVIDGHVGVHLGKLLHEPEKNDLLQGRDVAHKLAVEELALRNLIQVGLGILAQRQRREVGLDEVEEPAHGLRCKRQQGLLDQVLADGLAGGHGGHVEELRVLLGLLVGRGCALGGQLQGGVDVGVPLEGHAECGQDGPRG
mmetsp:Transcript_142747/g.456158  ORF Transcript_142747/g.456158 Transcript_142747/m.456158 type:complete len:291 (-) Transcript_142747:1051-1923(-)